VLNTTFTSDRLPQAGKHFIAGTLRQAEVKKDEVNLL
jgi:hypothetical protein